LASDGYLVAAADKRPVHDAAAIKEHHTHGHRARQQDVSYRRSAVLLPPGRGIIVLLTWSGLVALLSMS